MSGLFYCEGTGSSRTITDKLVMSIKMAAQGLPRGPSPPAAMKGLSAAPSCIRADSAASNLNLYTFLKATDINYKRNKKKVQRTAS